MDDSPEILTLNELMAGQRVVECEWIESRISSLIKLDILCAERDTFNKAFIAPSFSNSVYSTVVL